MIKYIKKIDLQGNEYLQETVICNRCKKPLEPTDYMYTLKLVSAHPVRIEPGCAYGLAPREPWHVCESCYSEVCVELDGEVKPRKTARWLGPQIEDYVNFAEIKSPAAAVFRSETLKNVCHCSNCNTRFDKRHTQQWKCCPVCESVIEKKPDMFVTIHKP